MDWLKSLSLLVCALVLVIPSCHGAVWTEEDEARARQQGEGRLNNVSPDAQEDGRAGDQGREEVLGRQGQGQGRLPQHLRDFGDSNPQLVSHRQQEDTFSIGSSRQYEGGQVEQRSRSRQFSQQTQYRDSQYTQYEGSFPQYGDEFQKYEGRFPQNGAEFQQYDGIFPQTGAEFQQNEGRFLQNGAEFQKHEQRFLQNGAEFQTYEERFSQNGAKFQQNEGRFPQNGVEFQKYEAPFPQNGAEFQQNEGRFLQNGAQFQQYEDRYPQYGSRPEGGATEFSRYEGRTQDASTETRTRYEDSQGEYETRYQDQQRGYETPYVDSQGEYETRYADQQRGYEDRSQLDLRGNVEDSQFDGRTQDDASEVQRDSADAQQDGRAQESISNESTDTTDLADERRISFDFLESRNAPKKSEPECLSCHIIEKYDKKPAEQVVDTRAAAEETGYLQNTFNYVSGIFQGEKQAPAQEEYFPRNPEPINPRFGAAGFNGRTFERNQDDLRPRSEYRSSVNPDFNARPKSSPSGFVKQEYSSEFRSQTQEGFNGRPGEFPASNYAQDLDGSEEYSTGFESQAQHDGRQRFPASGLVSLTQYDAPTKGFEYSSPEHASQDLPASPNSRFGSQFDDANEEGSIDSFGSEEEYLKYRLQQLGYEEDDLISVVNNPTSSAGANFNGQTDELTQEYSTQEFGQNQPIDAVGNERFGNQQDSTQYQKSRFGEQNQHGRTEGDAQSEYPEYRQEQQPYDGLGQNAQSEQDFLESRNAFEPKKSEPECLSCHIIEGKNPAEQEVDNRGAVEETGYLQDTFNYVSGIFQGEKQAPARAEYFPRNPDEYSSPGHESQDLPASPNSRFGTQFDNANEDGSIDNFDSEEEYLKYRLQQLGYDEDDLISVVNNPTSAGANFNGQTHELRQEYSTKEVGQKQLYDDLTQNDQPNLDNQRFGQNDQPNIDNERFGQNDAQSEYLEYRQGQQPYDGLGQNAQSQQYENFSFGEQQNQADAQSEYLKYRQEQRLYDSQFFDKPLQDVQENLGKGSQFENTRFGEQSILDIYHPEEAEQLEYLEATRSGSGYTDSQYRASTNARFGSTDQSGFGASRGFGEEYPSTGFESETRHQVEYSRTQHSFAGGSNFGQESRRFGAFPQDLYEAPPQKTEAELAFEARRLEFELAFEAEEVRRQAALEAEEARRQAAKEAFESEINRLRHLGCSSCHLVLEDAALHEGNTELLDLQKKEKKPLKVSKLMDLEDESVEAPRSVKSPRDGCVTCHLIQPPTPEPAPILEVAQRAGHLKVPILVEVDDAGKTIPLQKRDPSGALDLRKAASFRSSTFMETAVDRPFIPRSGPAPSRRRPSGSDSRRGSSGNDSRRLTATPIKPKIRGCRSCHIILQ